MSKLKQLKELWGYENDVPRCHNCAEFKESTIYLTRDSRTKRSNLHCKAGGFTVARNGCCDHWKGSDGSRLDGPPPPDPRPKPFRPSREIG